MVAQAAAAGGACAPGLTPIPAEIYPVGAHVALRVATPDIERAFGRGPFVLQYHERRDALHGWSLFYVLTNGVQLFTVDPANVIRVDDPAPDSEGRGGAPEDPGAAGGDSQVRWTREVGYRHESADGRFVIGLGPDKKWCASDRWTGEAVHGLALHASAEQWCHARLGGAPVIWQGGPRDWTGDHGGERFPIYSEAGTFCAFDRRLPFDHPLRQSPRFHDVERAKKWCEVRAACQLVHGENGNHTLAYRGEPEVPF